MVGRIVSLGVLAAHSACARPNPAFGDPAQGSTTAANPTAATSQTSGAAETTRDSTPHGASASTDPSEGPGSSGGSSSTGPGSASSVDAATSETETQVEPSNLLWVSAPVMGNWGVLRDDPCGDALAEAGAVCVNAPVVIAGHEEVPISELPAHFDFLSNAPFHAATTGEFVLASFDDLVDLRVEPGFVEALTAAAPSTNIYVWRGPLVEPANNCADWSNAELDASTFFFFESGSTEVSINGSAPCVSELRLLCACAGTL